MEGIQVWYHCCRCYYHTGSSENRQRRPTCTRGAAPRQAYMSEGPLDGQPTPTDAQHLRSCADHSLASAHLMLLSQMLLLYSRLLLFCLCLCAGLGVLPGPRGGRWADLCAVRCLPWRPAAQRRHVRPAAEGRRGGRVAAGVPLDGWVMQGVLWGGSWCLLVCLWQGVTQQQMPA